MSYIGNPRKGFDVMAYNQQKLDRERHQAQRNLNPHAEAIVAMNLWNDEYAFKQRGGVMDFWDAIGEARQKRCRELVDRIVSTKRESRPLRQDVQQ